MGQYWKLVNLTKKEFVSPGKLGCGLKLWEQLANHPSTGTALIVLCAAMPEKRGGGDLDLEENWHGPERTFPQHNVTPGPMPEDYAAVAQRTIGRWAGDRIAFVGDYAEDSDLPQRFRASTIYDKCSPTKKEVRNGSATEPNAASYRDTNGAWVHYVEVKPSVYLDITDDVCRVIEHELHGKFVGEGWREFQFNDQKALV